MISSPRRIPRELDSILIHRINQYYLTPDSDQPLFCASLSNQFHIWQRDLHIPVPGPDVLRLWFAQHVQCYSTAFLAGELMRLSDLLTSRITRLTSMLNQVIWCEQRGLLIPNQTQVLSTINEHFEFLTRHTLVDPHVDNARVRPTRAVPKCWRQVERLETAEHLYQFEHSIPTATRKTGQAVVSGGEIGWCLPDVRIVEERRDEIDGEDREVSGDAVENAFSDEEDDAQQDRPDGTPTDSAWAVPIGQLDQCSTGITDANRLPWDMGGEIPAPETEEEDSLESSDPPDDDESQTVLKLTPTPNVLFVLSLLSEGLSYSPVHRFLTKIRVRHCSERQFYRIQKVLVPWLHGQGKASCTTALKQVAEGDHIGFDGAWNHNRRGSKLFGTLCNVSKGSVVGYSIIEKRSRLSQPFEGPSNLMEAKSFRELLTTLTCPALKFAGLVTDGDVSIAKIIRNETKIRHLLDIGHCGKSFIRCFHTIDRKNGGILGPFGDRLLVWFRYLLSQDLPSDEKKELWQNALSHFRGDHSRCRHAPNDKDPVIRGSETDLIEAIRTFLSSTTKYFDLLEAGVRTQVNESLNAKRARFASKNLAWADSWVARMSLAVLHFNHPYAYFTELVRTIGFDLPDAYYQSLHELFSQSIKARRHPTGKRVWKCSMGNNSRTSTTGDKLSPHLHAASIARRTVERDDFVPDSSTESSDDDVEVEGDDDSDELTPFASGRADTDLVPGLDLSGLDNENGCCHLNSVIVALFGCRTFRRFFGPHDCTPSVEGEVWRHLIDLRSQMGTLVTQSTVELQFVLSGTADFSGYFERWQDAYETFERLIGLLAQTEFGADLIPLMSIAVLRETCHRCSAEPYSLRFRQGYLAVSEAELLRCYGQQSFGEFLRASAENEGISLESCPCCQEPTEVQYANQLLALPPVLIVRIMRDWAPGGRAVQVRPVPIPVRFHFEKFDLSYQLSAAICAQGSGPCDGHYYVTVRTESNGWYVYDDARVKAMGEEDHVGEVTDTIYFCLFEQL